MAQRTFDQNLQGERKSGRGNEALRFGALQADVFDPAVGSGKGRNKGRKQRFVRRSHGHSVTGPILERPAIMILIEIAGLSGKSAYCGVHPKR